jgi:hypothetical protein
MESGDSGVGSTEWESWSEVGVCVWRGVSQKWRVGVIRLLETYTLKKKAEDDESR